MTITNNHSIPDENSARKAICDTIRLRINADDFEIIEDKFDSPVNSILTYFGRGKATAYQGMSAEDKRLNYYKPRLLLINGPGHGGRNIHLLIDVSLPKLLYGNNLQEVCDQDFKPLVLKLRDVLLKMGIKIAPKTLSTCNSSQIASSLILSFPLSPPFANTKCSFGNISLALRIPSEAELSSSLNPNAHITPFRFSHIVLRVLKL